MADIVRKKILEEEKWSPDTAIGYAKLNNFYPRQEFCTKTIYNWIDDRLVKIKNMDLLLKIRRKSKNPRRERKKIPGKSIDERPAAANSREEYGHWESDGIAGKKQQDHLITMAERKSGIGMLYSECYLMFTTKIKRILSGSSTHLKMNTENISEIFPNQ